MQLSLLPEWLCCLHEPAALRSVRHTRLQPPRWRPCCQALPYRLHGSCSLRLRFLPTTDYKKFLLHPECQCCLHVSAASCSVPDKPALRLRWRPCCQVLRHRSLQSYLPLPLRLPAAYRTQLLPHPEHSCYLPEPSACRSVLRKRLLLFRSYSGDPVLLHRSPRSCLPLPLQLSDCQVQLLPHPEHPCCLPAASDLRSEHRKQLRRLRWLPCCQALHRQWR